MNGVASDDALEVAEIEGTPIQSNDLPADLSHLAERERAQSMALRRLSVEQEHRLRQSYADWILRMLGGQLLLADAVFVVFAWAGTHWVLPPGVIEAWLAATVVQVVGIVALVTRHLFPGRDDRKISA